MDFLTYLDGQLQDKTHTTDTFLKQAQKCLMGEFLCEGLEFDAKEDISNIIEEAYKYYTEYLTEINRYLSDLEKSLNLMITLAWHTGYAKADRGQFQDSKKRIAGTGTLNSENVRKKLQ